MSNTIDIDRWLDVIDAEYLNAFVAAGGGAVKIAIADPPVRLRLAREVKRRATSAGYLCARVDAGECRVHMPQDIFHSLAGQIDWRRLARSKVLAVAAGRGLEIEGIDPNATGPVEAIAGRNNIASGSVLLELRPALQYILDDPRMARDFRTAMYHLCMGECVAPAAHPLLDWLTGVNPRIGPLRPYSIHTPINRTTARYFIESALYWVGHTGAVGTVLMLDTSRIALARNPRDGARYYSRAMAIDHYELLREFVDDADRLSHTLLLVATSGDFVDDQAPRGWRIYDALRTRVMDDVRDRHHVNPVAALVRLASNDATTQ